MPENWQPSSISGQVHSAKGSTVEAIGNATGSDAWKTSGKEERAAGDKEYEDARASGWTEGLVDSVQGKMNSVMGALTGNTQQQRAGEAQQKQGAEQRGS